MRADYWCPKSFFSLSLSFVSAFFWWTWPQLGKWSHPFQMLTQYWCCGSGPALELDVVIQAAEIHAASTDQTWEWNEVRTCGCGKRLLTSRFNGWLLTDCHSHLKHRCKIKVRNVSFILFSGWIFSPSSGPVHFKLIVLLSILNTFKHQTHWSCVKPIFDLNEQSGFSLCAVRLFYCVAAANMKANLWQDQPLNERFMIQCCVLMPELQSVMRQ